MSRREFLRRAGLALGGASLAGCSVFGSSQVDWVATSKWMDPMTLRHVWTTVKGLEMHAMVSVEPAPAGAPALVFVHGSGLSHRYMIPTATKLIYNFRVYLPDMPGFGDSAKPEEVFDVSELADWLVAWMPTVGLERASFLGNSFGCQVIADLAARYPERVERAILQGPTTPPDERTWWWQLIRWRQNQRYNPDWLGSVSDQAYEKAGWRRLFRSFIYQLRDRIEDKMPFIQAPVLVVCGERDPIANVEWCARLARLCPNGRLEVIPGVAHTLVFTAPILLAAVTREFLHEGALRPRAPESGKVSG